MERLKRIVFTSKKSVLKENKGYTVLLNPRLNKGTAFTLEKEKNTV
jgi:hypothetical protein